MRLTAAAPGALLIAAACLASGRVHAQTAFTSSDPLAPKLETNSKKPPRFQKVQRTTDQPFATPQAFAPASGAGRTGFDSTNTRKKAAARKSNANADAQAIAPGLPQPLTLTPDQKPANAAFAQAPAAPPGAPPVEIGPIRKLPPKRRAHVEPPDPYAQLGIQAGAFDLYPAIEFIGGYASNPGAEPDPHGAALYTIAPELRAQSNWSRHELKADLRGSYTGYSPDETPTLSRPYFNGKVDGRVDVRDTTHVNLGGRVLVSTDNPGSPNLQAGLSKLPVYMTYGGNAGVTQRFNRFELTTKSDVERTSYQDSELTDGTTASNRDRNFNQYGVTLRGGYELSPGVTPFVEVGTDKRVHDIDTDINGYQRNSKGYVANVGSTFELTRLLAGEASIGYAIRDYDDPRFDRLKGLIGNASLTWTVDALNTVKFTASSTIGESTVAGVPGVFYRDAGIQFDHAFRRWLIGTLKLGIGQDLYKGSSTPGTSPVCDCVQSTPGSNVADRTDDRYSVGLGLTYKLSRRMQIKGEFQQLWLRSNVSGVSYDASTFLLGLRLQE